MIPPEILGKRLEDVLQDVVAMLEAHGDANKAGGDIDGGSFFRGELGVGGAGRMGGDAFGIAEIGGQG